MGYRPKIHGKGAAFSCDKTTTGAWLIPSLSLTTYSVHGYGVIRYGDKTTPCPECGEPGTVVEGDSRWTIHGAASAVDGGRVRCNCPYGSNRIIAPLGQWMGSGPSPEQIAAKKVASTPLTQATTSGPDIGAAMKGAVWPPYNPIRGEDLTEQLRAALEANHQKAIILTLDDAAATLQDMIEEYSWEKHGTQTLKAANTANDLGGHGAAIYRAYSLAKQFGDYGVKATVFNSMGNEYLAITTKNNGDKVLRHVLVNGVRVKLNGHKYRLNNYKVMQLGLTPQNRMSGYKGTAAVTFIISAAINTNELILNGDYHLVDWFGNVGSDMFQAIAAVTAGEIILLGIGTFTGGVGILAGAAVVIGISLAVGWIFEEWDVSEKIVSELKHAIN